MADRWFELSKQFPVGPKRGAVLRSMQPTDDVIPGQIRRAYWGDASAFVVIAAADEVAARVRVLPATLEPGVEDATSTIVESEVSPLHGPITVWPRAAANIPFAALDAAVATIPRPLLDTILEMPSAELAGTGLRRGRGNPALGSGTALAVDDIFDAIEVLKSVPGLRESAAAAPVTRLEVDLQLIMTALEVSQPRAMAIRIGKEPLTREQADKLATAAGVSVHEVLAAVAPLPDDLQRELQHPRWRVHIRRRAVQGDELAARTRLGYAAFQLAARETGQDDERWRQRIEAVLAADDGHTTDDG